MTQYYLEHEEELNSDMQHYRRRQPDNYADRDTFKTMDIEKMPRGYQDDYYTAPSSAPSTAPSHATSNDSKKQGDSARESPIAQIAANIDKNRTTAASRQTSASAASTPRSAVTSSSRASGPHIT